MLFPWELSGQFSRSYDAISGVQWVTEVLSGCLEMRKKEGGGGKSG